MSRSITWFPPGVDPRNPDGSEIVLEGDPASPFEELVGADGFGAPSWDLAWSFTPGIDGGQLNQVSSGIGEQTWRFLLKAASPPEFKAAFRALVLATNPKRGVGIFQVADFIGTDHGDVRQIRAVCAGGLRGDALLARGADTTEWPFDLQLATPEPYWYSTEPVTASWQGKPAWPTFPMQFPIRMNPWGVDLVDVLVLDGDIESWGTYSLAGPWSRVRFTNDRTGQWWEMTRSNSGEGLLVRTKPGEVSVQNLLGENRYGFTAGSQLFALEPGDSMTVTADGATEDTVFQVEVTPTWLTAP